jgi:hypothetical protein
MKTPSAAKPLSALAAARKVLAAAGKPLHYQEITRRILAAGLWRTAGKTPEVFVNPDGTIRFNGRSFTSPSLAGAAAVNRRSCNGWNFWEYEATPGHWLKLDTLRK